MLDKKIAQFLNTKIMDVPISKKDLSEKTGLAPSIIFDLAKGYKKNPELATLCKIADALNTSVDEICGRDPAYYNTHRSFRSIDAKEAMTNLKSYIEHKMLETHTTPHQLGRRSGFSIRAITSFVSPTPEKQSLGSAIIVGVADYFKVSIDDMIGRASPVQQRIQDVGAHKDQVTNVESMVRGNSQAVNIPEILTKLYAKDINMT